jgi:histidinol dehydrogenase
MHVIDVDRDAFERVRGHVAALATAEGLAAHADSVRRRVELIEGAPAPAGTSAEPA